MNLDIIRPKNETKTYDFQYQKNCGSLTEQTHRKIEETLEFNLNKPRETFHFNPSMTIERF